VQHVGDEPHAVATPADAKKKSVIAAERDTPEARELRRQFLTAIRALDPTKLKFIDEAGSHIAMTRGYARTTRGNRAEAAVPRNRGTVTTMIGVLSLAGLCGMMTVEGATDTAVFDTFVERILVPRLSPGDTVVLDNLGAHKPAPIRKRIEAAGARVLFLPPYSPDLNPIEECWSKLKALLKRIGARTRQELDLAIAECMELITPSDAAGWFRHSGYHAQTN
jgi:transposase